jgi:DNA segregation ATPase FtsK/SpoIIIE-like protein
MHKLSKHGVYDRVGDVETKDSEVPDFPVPAVVSWRRRARRLGYHRRARLIMHMFGDIEGVFVDAFAAAIVRRT